MLTSVVAGLLKLGPWTAIAAVLALSTGLAGSFWYSARTELERARKDLIASQAEVAKAKAETLSVAKTLASEIEWRDGLTEKLDQLAEAQTAIAKEVSDAIDEDPVPTGGVISRRTADRVRAGWAARAAAAKAAMQNPRRPEED